MYTLKKLLLAIVASAMILISCDKNEDSEQQSTLMMNQADLNGAKWPVQLGLTGAPYGETVTIPHTGTDLTFDQTVRDVYANKQLLTTDQNEVGTIISKRVFAKDSLGNRGDLLAIFAMAKHELGYFVGGGDWEYIKVDLSDMPDTSIYPNGLLPALGAETRGKLISCASCHSKANGNNFMFVN